MLTQKSMAIDGVYIESIIDGYTTLDVTGRESLASTLDTITVANRHGSIYKGKTYNPRTLTISFAIEGDTPEDCMDDLETLNGLLDIEHVQVYFMNEADRYYNVDAFTNPSFSVMNAPGSGNAVATGTFEAYCSDPFKYSNVADQVVEPMEDEDGYPLFIVDYAGTYKAYPTFETTFYTKTDQDRHKDERIDRETALDDEKLIGYQSVALDADDFEEDEYYLITAQPATSYDEMVAYYIHDLQYEEDDDDAEEADDGDDDATVVGESYILAEGLSADDITPDSEITYYTLSLSLAQAYDPNATYFIESVEIIPTDVAFEYMAAAENEPDTLSGIEEEDLRSSGGCGYVAFVNQDANILQFGDPTMDGIIKHAAATQRLVNTAFTQASNYDADTRAQWGAGSKLPDVISDGKTVDGSYSEKLRKNVVYASITSSQTVLAWTAAASGCQYNVVVESVKTRTATSAVLNFKISCKRTGDTIYKNGTKYTTYTTTKKKKKKKVTKKHSGTNIIAHLNVGNNDYEVALLTTSQTFTKGSTISKTYSITLSELNTDTQSYSGMKFSVSSSGEYSITKGSTNMTAISLPRYIPMPATDYYLAPNYISARGWHGPVITRTIPADSNGDYGAKAFDLTVSGKFCIGNGTNYNLQQGILGIYLVSQSNALVAGMEICKTVTSASQAYVRCYAANKLQYTSPNADYATYDDTQSFNLKIERPVGSNDVEFSFTSVVPDKQVQKYKTVTEKYTVTTKKTVKKGKKKKTVTVKTTKTRSVQKADGYNTIAGTRNMPKYTYKGGSLQDAYKIIIASFSNGSVPALAWLGVTGVVFNKNGITDTENVNVFHPTDQLIVDCNSGDIKLNNLSAQGYGALGNDWDSFALNPGVNQIRALYSDWAKEAEVYRKCLHSDSWSSATDYYIQSGSNYVKTTVTEAQFAADPNKYFVKEEAKPSFLMRYREVYI